MDLTNSTEKPPLDNIKGNIEFNNVNFYYPSDINKKLVFITISVNYFLKNNKSKNNKIIIIRYIYVFRTK